MFKQSLKPYEKYKDSGVEWIGEIPGHWENVKIKHIFKERSQKGYPNEPLLAATQTKGVVPKEMYENRTVIAFNDLQNLKLVKKGDFVISLRSFQGGIEIAHYRGIISPAYTVMIPCKAAYGGYFKFLFKSKGLIGNLNIYVTGIRQGQNIDYSKFKNSMMPLPSISEQKKIAEYLNRKTQQADTLIEKQTRLVELLKEQKKAIINKAVTKGLNPDAPMKDSGIEWLGEIPAHWEARRIRRLTLQHKQGYYTTGEYVENGIKLIRITDIQEDGKINFSDMPCVRISENDKKIFKVKKGDFLFARTGGVGIFGFVENDESATFASYLIRFRLKKDAQFNFLKFYFLSDYFITSLKNSIHGGVNQNVHAENIKEQYVTLPPKQEQQQIVSHIETKTAKIDQAIEKAEKEITLVKEYLQSLIYQVVTGRLKIDKEIIG